MPVVGRGELDDLLARADFITLHVPFDKKRGAVLGPKEFEMMKDGVVIINCARGGVVDEARRAVARSKSSA